MRKLIDRIGLSLTPSFLFKNSPAIDFMVEVDICPECLQPLNVHKTKFRTVFTMHIGCFKVREKLLKCNKCGNENIHGSQELSDLVPEGSNYGYDVMVFIGESMFFNHQQAREIKTHLGELNIPISISEIEYLSRKFIIYLSLVHERNNGGIVNIMEANGGYILHIDALGGAKGGQRLISGVDGVSDIVLENGKIKSENSDYIIPFLEKIKDRFGVPLAVVQDMGKGITKASQTVFPTVLILICHFHFLRDIGKDLLDENYDIIRKRLRHFGFLVKLRSFSKELKLQFEDNHKDIDKFYQARKKNQKIDPQDSVEITIYLYTLIEWVLDWKSESNAYGFPFDRPHVDLATRLEKALEVLNTMNMTGIGQQLNALITEITEDVELKNSMREIGNEIEIFDELRDAMRVAPKDGKNGLNDENKDVPVKTIEEEVDKFRESVVQKVCFSQLRNGSKFLKQIDKYRKNLFADPIVVKTANGTKVIEPQKTNNLMEQMFRDFSRGNKRKTGTDSIGRTIRSMVDNTPLIRNLKNEEYKDMILGDKKNLSEVFAEIDVKKVRQKMKEHNVCNENIPQKIKKLLKEDTVLDMLTNIVDL